MEGLWETVKVDGFDVLCHMTAHFLQRCVERGRDFDMAESLVEEAYWDLMDYAKVGKDVDVNIIKGNTTVGVVVYAESYDKVTVHIETVIDARHIKEGWPAVILDEQ